jgi:CelD/BcsL family acetyltransferase involved in cellulose biosynthesis
LTTEQREHPFADAARIGELATRVDAKYMRRNVKMLEKQGTLRYEILREPSAIRPLLDDFFAMHVRNFAGTGRVSQFASPDDRHFYEYLVALPSLRDVIRMDVLYVADRPVALHLGFEHRGWIYYYKPTFDLDHAKASPGKIMLAHLFARAASDGVERIDLLKGKEPYKDEWANHSRVTGTTNLVERSVTDLVRAARRRWTHA